MKIEDWEKIPVSARIFAIADAYDAIVLKRPYKEPLPHEEADKRIKKDSGAHFDPAIVNSFLEVSTEFKKINERYVETHKIITPLTQDSYSPFIKI